MEHIYLMGSEDVQTAGYSMKSAAEDMRMAANTIDESLRNHQRFLEQWLADLGEVMRPNDQEVK